MTKSTNKFRIIVKIRIFDIGKKHSLHHGKRIQTLSGDFGTPLCQRTRAHRSPGGSLHTFGHLHALPASAGPRRRLGLRIGRAWRAHHHQSPQGGRHAAGDRRSLPQPYQGVVPAAGHVVRHLFAHFVRNPCRNGVGFFPQALRRGQVHRENVDAVLRRGGQNVPR